MPVLINFHGAHRARLSQESHQPLFSRGPEMDICVRNNFVFSLEKKELQLLGVSIYMHRHTTQIG